MTSVWPHVVWASLTRGPRDRLPGPRSAPSHAIQKTPSGFSEQAGYWRRSGADFARGNRDTDLVLPDASASLSEEIVGQPISLYDYANHNYTRQLDAFKISPDRRQDLGAIFEHNLVAFGDFHAAQAILALTSIPSSLHLTLSRFYSADSIKRNNLILIGGKKANPWVRLFDDPMNFALDLQTAITRN